MTAMDRFMTGGFHRVALGSLEEATTHASFIVRVPQLDALDLISIEHWWPKHVAPDARERKTHADVVWIDYRGSAGDRIQVIQGFTGRHLLLATAGVPRERVRTTDVAGRTALLMAGRPADDSPSTLDAEGRQVLSKWVDGDYNMIGWWDAIYHPTPEHIDGNPSSYSLMSDGSVPIDRLLALAKTVPVVPLRIDA